MSSSIAFVELEKEVVVLPGPNVFRSGAKPKVGYVEE
jgi:hypothetical protein